MNFLALQRLPQTSENQCQYEVSQLLKIVKPARVVILVRKIKVIE